AAHAPNGRYEASTALRSYSRRHLWRPRLAGPPQRICDVTLARNLSGRVCRLRINAGNRLRKLGATARVDGANPWGAPMSARLAPAPPVRTFPEKTRGARTPAKSAPRQGIPGWGGQSDRGIPDTAPGRALTALDIGAPPEGPGRRPEARTFPKVAPSTLATASHFRRPFCTTVHGRDTLHVCILHLQDIVKPIPFFLRGRGGHPRTKFFFKKSPTQPVQPDVQAEGVDWLPTHARQLPVGASNSGRAGLGGRGQGSPCKRIATVLVPSFQSQKQKS
ncbi:hypothetical protein PCANC_27676, partial [Puccinia coronata f. sp. avenae]